MKFTFFAPLPFTFLTIWSNWQPTPVVLPRKFHGQRSLVGYSPQGCKESDMTERLHFHFLQKKSVWQGLTSCNVWCFIQDFSISVHWFSFSSAQLFNTHDAKSCALHTGGILLNHSGKLGFFVFICLFWPLKPPSCRNRHDIPTPPKGGSQRHPQRYGLQIKYI